MEEHFIIDGEYIELIRLLKATGLCETGGMAKGVVEDGLVTVDGHAEYRKRRKIRKGQTVALGEHIIRVD
ncbi:RNA-binding protein [Desulfonema ishimotonii]|uniref:RNA-binding protein n=1 Tax=Desulfonema ishimotonii TaxID=45657 RepID=A0A401FSG8_9BACT|nr:RNA-binding S4 domain-containing protein [Desulfonema ishimotonii]GBC59905.1 RNA-binding protein [Desulfonema ishimotonii]